MDYAHWSTLQILGLFALYDPIWMILIFVSQELLTASLDILLSKPYSVTQY